MRECRRVFTDRSELSSGHEFGVMSPALFAEHHVGQRSGSGRNAVAGWDSSAPENTGWHILGFMLNKASEANIAHRTLLLAYTHIKAFEQRRAAGRLP
jgi:hypothetical protein